MKQKVFIEARAKDGKMEITHKVEMLVIGDVYLSESELEDMKKFFEQLFKNNDVSMVVLGRNK